MSDERMPESKSSISTKNGVSLSRYRIRVHTVYVYVDFIYT